MLNKYHRYLWKGILFCRGQQRCPVFIISVQDNYAKYRQIFHKFIEDVELRFQSVTFLN